jgi:hypothetical protein
LHFAESKRENGGEPPAYGEINASTAHTDFDFLEPNDDGDLPF